MGQRIEAAREPGNDEHRILVTYCGNRQGSAYSHEKLTLRRLAEKLAYLMAVPFGGEFEPDRHYEAPLYFFPLDTLSGEEGRRLGIRGEDDLFGGVAPFPFVASKMITHPLPGADCKAPIGWSRQFSEMSREVVLPGFSAFTIEDARYAALSLLEQGAVRIKKASGVGGAGQTVVNDAAELETLLSTFDPARLLQEGVVVERNLREVTTCSVGKVIAGAMLITYCGTQRTTAGTHGEEAYGGSDLLVVRGDFDVLLQQKLPAAHRMAVEQAGIYHHAALTSFPGLFASRCNYDIAQGVDDAGRWYSGVLEQSWRMGGASPAELAAMAAFQEDTNLQVVRASSVEIYGEHGVVPARAEVYFDGVDERAGRLLKYSRVEV